jgi:hypothetical protein
LELCVLRPTGGVNLVCHKFNALDALLQIFLVDQKAA